MNPITATRHNLAEILETLPEIRSRTTPPEIITPPLAVIDIGTITPSERYDHLIITFGIDLITPLRSDFEAIQAELDGYAYEAAVALLNDGLEIEQISQPFNVQDAEGSIFPALTLTVTQEIAL